MRSFSSLKNLQNFFWHLAFKDNLFFKTVKNYVLYINYMLFPDKIFILSNLLEKVFFIDFDDFWIFRNQHFK